MPAQHWIMSEGGPLIAVERELQELWGGILRLTIPSPGASNDYDRPPKWLDYLQTIKLQRGEGLIFGEGPVDTTFWQASDRQLFIVRPIYCESDFDVAVFMRDLDENLFADPVEQIDFRFFSGNIVIFDSAEDGSRPDVTYIAAKITPGLYKISTIVQQIEHSYCVIVHNIVIKK